jgi:hypothetical protein
MGYKYCLRWHDVTTDDRDHEACCWMPGLEEPRWGMERHHFIREFVLGIKPTVGCGEAITDRTISVHLIHPEDWDYIGEAGV